MIIHNKVHQALINVAREQNWNDKSQILHLCGFLQQLINNPRLTKIFLCDALLVSGEKAILKHFHEYLRQAQNEENEQ